jgi:putative selenium metabolism protein SsnA
MLSRSNRLDYLSNKSVKLIITGPAIFTNDDSMGLLESGAILIGNGQILEIGPLGQLRKTHTDVPVENIGTGLITPGLVNLHHHLYSSFARGWAVPGEPPQNFAQILERVWWRLDKALGRDDIYHSAIIGLCESIQSGVTAVVDHHASQNTVRGSLELIADAFNLVGLRGSICFELSDREGEKIFDTALKESVNALSKWPVGTKGERISAMVGLHASLTLSDVSLKKIADATKIYDTGYHFHLAEDAIDQKESLAKHGIRATERFANFGILNEKSLAVHGVHLEKSEIELLRNAKVNLALCPRSNQNNAVGFARWWEYDGVTIGWGSDGIGSDILNEAKSALYLSRHIKRDPDFGFGQVGDIMLNGNPNIYTKLTGQKIGRLAQGYPADIVFWNYQAPTPISADNILGHYLYGLYNQKADSVWVDGQRILKGGQFVNLDYEKLMAESRQMAKALWERI